MFTQFRADARPFENHLTLSRLERWLRPLPSLSEAELVLQSLAGVKTPTTGWDHPHSLPLLVAVLRDVFARDAEVARWLLSRDADLDDAPAQMLNAGACAAVLAVAAARWNRAIRSRDLPRHQRAHFQRFAMKAAATISLGCMFAASPNAAAQAGDPEALMLEVLQYADVARPAAIDVARLLRSWNESQRTDITTLDRQRAYRDLLATYSALQGSDTAAAAAALDANARFAASILDRGGRMDLRLPTPRGRVAGKTLHMETRGAGATQLLLIPDIGVDGSEVYAPLLRTGLSDYTMHVITLPFAGRAHPLPWPERLDYSGRPWLKHIEGELLELVDALDGRRKIIVVGTVAGGYFAARLALLRPERVDAVVLVNALVHMPLPPGAANGDPSALRARFVRRIPPAPQLWPVAPIPSGAALRRLIEDSASSHPSVQNWMAFAVKDTALSRTWTYAALSGGFFLPANRYRWELATTDLTSDLQHLAVPTLALVSRHDAASPTQSFPAIDQWQEIKRRYPRVPLTVVTLDDTRSYVSADDPGRFRRELGTLQPASQRRPPRLTSQQEREVDR